MTSLQEASAVLFLALGGWESITNGIFAFYIAGSANEAAALGVILILVAAISDRDHQSHGRHPHGRRLRLAFVPYWPVGAQGISRNIGGCGLLSVGGLC